MLCPHVVQGGGGPSETTVRALVLFPGAPPSWLLYVAMTPHVNTFPLGTGPLGFQHVNLRGTETLRPGHPR